MNQSERMNFICVMISMGLLCPLIDQGLGLSLYCLVPTWDAQSPHCLFRGVSMHPGDCLRAMNGGSTRHLVFRAFSILCMALSPGRVCALFS